MIDETEIMRLKARAYDLLATIQHAQAELEQVNNQIRNLQIEKNAQSKPEGNNS